MDDERGCLRDGHNTSPAGIPQSASFSTFDRSLGALTSQVSPARTARTAASLVAACYCVQTKPMHVLLLQYAE